MKGLCLIVWMFLSLILVFSIIGLLMFVPKDRYSNSGNTPSTWCKIGLKLMKSIVEK